MNKLYEKILKKDILRPIIAHKKNSVWRWINNKELNELIDEKIEILHNHKVKPTERIIYQGKNSVDTVAWNLATWKIGGIWVPIFHDLVPNYYINNCKPKLLIKENQIEVFNDSTETKHDLACLIYTSGTSGTPKGVMLTHDNLISNIGSLQRRFSEFNNLTTLNILPWYHIYSLTTELHYNLLSDNKVVISSGKEHFISDCREVNPDILYVVPRVLEMISIKLRYFNCSFLLPIVLKNIFGKNIKTIFVGGSKLDSETKKFYLDNGINLCEGYGSTECSPMVSVNHLKEPRNTESVGKILDNVLVEIVNSEIQVSGPNVMKGYWNSDNVLIERDSKLWYRTGDMGRVEDGFLFYEGRISETYKLSNGKFCNPLMIQNNIKSLYNHNFIIYGDNRPYNILITEKYMDIEKINKYISKHLRVKKIMIVDFTNYMTPKLSIKRKQLINDNLDKINQIYG